MSNNPSNGFQNARIVKQASDVENELTGFNNIDGEDENQFVYDEDKDIDRQNEESFA